jgi:hypothetical protein
MPKTSKTELGQSKRDHYDRAVMGRSIMTNMAASGDQTDQAMLTLMAATTIIDALLAVADALYLQTGYTREELSEE